MKNLNSFMQYFGLFVLFAYVSLSLIAWGFKRPPFFKRDFNNEYK